MLRSVFRTKEGKIITVILIFIVIIIGAFAYTNYSENKQYKEQAVMAENYLNSGDFEQAVNAYLKAMSMKNSGQELLSIGLSEAYIGVNDYDNALETLRSCYQKTSGVRIKEKIEEVTSRKTDYDYLQIISRADIYFSNKEYDKAIDEYEKAKLIKSKEIIAYHSIAEAYIEKGEYGLAKEELIEGIELTQSDELNQILDTVDVLLLKQQYDLLVAAAAEYIYQENYEDGIKSYKEAIMLMPKEEQAYSQLADTYLAQQNYQKAVTLLQDALKQTQSDVLKGLLSNASELLLKEKERKEILSELYEAFDKADGNKIKEIMNTEAFKTEIAVDSPLYYSPLGEGDISKGYGMIIYDSENIYSGEISESMKKGSGVYAMLVENKGEQGYYYYNGEWSNDIPNGNGKSVEETVLKDENSVKYNSKIVTEGSYFNGTENGSMKKTFYVNGIETGNILYSAENGIPTPITDENGQITQAEEGKPYVIGILNRGIEPTNEYYSVEPGTIWGVKPFIAR